MLVNTPDEFLNTYGYSFVIGYETTASFFGSCSIHSEFKKSMSSLEVSFDVSYSDVFSASGSDKFSTAVSNESKNIQITCQQKTDGSSSVPFNFKSDTGADIYQAYQTWHSNLHPYKDTVIFASWLDIDEVSEAVMKMSYEDRKKFSFQPSQTVMNRLSTEFSYITYLYNTLNQYARVECLDDVIKEKVNKLKEQVYYVKK